MLSQNHDINLYEPGTPPTAAALEGPDQHQAFIDGIEICADRFPGDEDRRVSCFAEVVKTTIGRRASKRTGTAIPCPRPRRAACQASGTESRSRSLTPLSHIGGS